LRKPLPGAEWGGTLRQYLAEINRFRAAEKPDSGMERWRPYERHLGPLLDALGDLAPQRN
jgi:hypothetical protein